MYQNKILKKIALIKKLSNYSIFISGIAVVIKMFFSQYFEGYIWLILSIGLLAFMLFAIAELLVFILKKRIKKNENLETF